MEGDESEMNLVVRPITEIEEFREAVRIQKVIWGFDDIDLLPPRLFVVANKVGGLTLAAFDGEAMVGFLIAIPGIKPDGSTFWHSHMTGTLEGYRDKGLGRMLKLKQREEALDRKLDLIEWTFDPLELRNAYFNIEKLGAVVRRYVPNQYGTTSSHLQGGLPSDRCVAEWWIRTPRVASLLEGKPLSRPPVEARVSIPLNIGELKASDPQAARAIQKELGEQFQEHFRNNLSVVGFEKSETLGTYLLSEWE